MSIFMGVVILNMVVSSCLRICFSWFVSGYAGGGIAESVFSADLLVSFSICRILSDAFGAESISRLSRSRDSSFLVVWRFSSLLGFGLAIVCSSTFRIVFSSTVLCWMLTIADHAYVLVVASCTKCALPRVVVFTAYLRTFWFCSLIL